MTPRGLFDFGSERASLDEAKHAHALWIRYGRRSNPVDVEAREIEPPRDVVHVDAHAHGETSIVVRGDEVSFLEVGTGKETVLPDDFLVVQDVSGTTLRKCDLYFLRNRGRASAGIDLTPAAHQAVKKWYGDGARVEKYRVDLPEGAWQRVAKIDGIRYRREGDLAGPYEHPYDPPVVLFRSSRTPAWRVVHPDGCIIDERGIVHP